MFSLSQRLILLLFFYKPLINIGKILLCRSTWARWRLQPGSCTRLSCCMSTSYGVMPTSLTEVKVHLYQWQLSYPPAETRPVTFSEEEGHTQPHELLLSNPCWLLFNTVLSSRALSSPLMALRFVPANGWGWRQANSSVICWISPFFLA